MMLLVVSQSNYPKQETVDQLMSSKFMHNVIIELFC
jgi:hypothetical protein